AVGGDEEILDLTDVVEEPRKDEEATILLDEIEAAGGDEEILDLTDAVEEPRRDEEATILLDEIEAAGTDEEEILELTDAIEAAEADEKERVDLEEAVAASAEEGITGLDGGEPPLSAEEEMIEFDEPAETAPEAEIPELADETGELFETEPDGLGLSSDLVSPDTAVTESAVEKTETAIPVIMDRRTPIPIGLEDTVELTQEEAAELESPESASEVDEELIELIESAGVETAEEEEFPDFDETAEMESDLLEDEDALRLDDEGETPDEVERGKAFADSLGVELVSALVPAEQPPEKVPKDERVPEKPGLMAVHVQDNRQEGGPIDFKFESRLHPGEKVYREKYIEPDMNAVTPSDLEKALQRVVREMFAEKIDRMLTDVIQKVVEEEIRKIKNALLEE
ncbi:MAG: hypothetical protein ACOZF0_02490, partial [Thermodesulfobacteriota bacterium]